MISVVIRQSLVQMETPDAMRGRVSAVNSMFIGTSNQLGEFESGVTAAWLGVVPAVLIGGSAPSSLPSCGCAYSRAFLVSTGQRHRFQTCPVLRALTKPPA